jgi:hypothetical protein
MLKRECSSPNSTITSGTRCSLARSTPIEVKATMEASIVMMKNHLRVARPRGRVAGRR